MNEHQETRTAWADVVGAFYTHSDFNRLDADYRKVCDTFSFRSILAVLNSPDSLHWPAHCIASASIEFGAVRRSLLWSAWK